MVSPRGRFDRALLLTAGAQKKALLLAQFPHLNTSAVDVGLSGQATDNDIHAKEILRMRTVINGLLAQHSSQSVEKVEKDVERDFIMSARKRKKYGLIDEIITKHR